MWPPASQAKEMYMLREKAEKYYLEGDYNCAEAILRAANDAYAQL